MLGTQGINLLAFGFLETILTLPGFEATTLVVDCFNLLAGCVTVTDGRLVAVTRGSERLAATAAAQPLFASSHAPIVKPTSRILEDVRQRYRRTFPPKVDLWGLPF